MCDNMSISMQHQQMSVPSSLFFLPASLALIFCRTWQFSPCTISLYLSSQEPLRTRPGGNKTKLVLFLACFRNDASHGIKKKN